MSKFTHHHLFRILLVTALSTIIGMSVLTGAVAAAEDFEISIVDYDEEVPADGDFKVTVEINNTGTSSGTQNITLTDYDGNVKNDTVVVSNLDTDDLPREKTITWGNVPRQELIEPRVKTENATSNPNAEATVPEPVEVLWSDFEVEKFDVNRTDLSSGEDLQFDATIENTGTDTGYQTIDLNLSTDTGQKRVDVEPDSGLKEIGPSRSAEITFDVISAPSTSGEYIYTIATANDSSEQGVTVSGGFTVESLDTSTDGRNLTVTATLSKRGSHAERQPVDFSIDGTHVETKRPRVEGTEGTVTFTNDTGQLTFEKVVTITTQRAVPEGRKSARIIKIDNKNLGPGNFVIDKLTSTSNIQENGNLTVEATIRNKKPSFNATQTIELVDNETGEIIQEKEVLINEGKTKKVKLYWDPVPSLPDREIRPEIRTENDTEARDEFVNIQPRSFEIRELTVNKSSVSTDDGLEFTATVRNVGTQRTKERVYFVAPGGVRVSKLVRLGAKETDDSVSFTTNAPARPGEYAYTVESNSSQKTQSVTAGDFNVEITDVTFEGSIIRVNGEVSKRGSYTSTQPIELFINGNNVDEIRNPGVTVSGTSPTEVTLEAQNIGQFPKTVRLKAPDSLASQNSDVTKIEKLNIKNGPKITNVTDTFVQSGDTLEFTYTAAGPNVGSVEASIVNPNGETVVSGQPLTAGIDETGTITIPSRDAIIDGGYDLRITVTSNIQGINSRVSDTVTGAFIVSNAINPEAIGVLGEPVTRTPAGDFATIPTGGQYMLIGGNMDSGDRQQYLDILHVSGGSTTVNTRLIGTDRPSEQAYGEGVTSYAHSIGANAGSAARQGTVFEGVSFEDASSLAEFRSNIGISARSAPLQAGRYQLVAGEKGRVTLRDDGDVGFVKSVGRSNLILTQTQRIGEITTYVLPPGKASETTIGEAAGATESQSVAIGERLVIEVPATGMWGATLPDSESEMSAEQIAKLLRDHEGIRIEFAPRDPFNDPNAGAGSLRFSDVSEEDLNVIADTTTDLWENETTVGDEPTFGGYYIVIDTRGTEPFDNRPGDEEYMRFEMAYESPPGSSYQFQSYDFRGGNQPAPFSPANEPVDGVEHYPYFGDDDTTVQQNTTVLFKEPSVQYDRVMPDGDLIVPAQPDGQIFGSTTIAPESQVTIQLISGDGPNPEIVTIEDVTIDEDRRFEVQADFSTLTPGQSVEVEFYAQNRLEENRLIDSRDLTVVDNIDNPAQFMIQSLPSEVTVQQRASLSDIQTTIRNTGSISGQKLVEFRINDEPIKNETIILGSNTSETLDLSDQFVTLPVGTYDYTVRTEDDAQTGVLRVTESESGATVTNTGSATTTSSSVTNEQTPGGDGNGDSSPSGLFGLVGVSGRDVALGTAITGAAHVLGYWT